MWRRSRRRGGASHRFACLLWIPPPQLCQPGSLRAVLDQVVGWKWAWPLFKPATPTLFPPPPWGPGEEGKGSGGTSFLNLASAFLNTDASVLWRLSSLCYIKRERVKKKLHSWKKKKKKENRSFGILSPGALFFIYPLVPLLNKPTYLRVTHSHN